MQWLYSGIRSTIYWIVNSEDISEFVRQQRQNIKFDCVELLTPSETVYPVVDVNTTS